MIEVKIVKFQNPFKESIQNIRNAVFIVEQGISVEIEIDGRDYDALHALAYFNGVAVGTGRILEDGHIGRIAVLKEHRNLCVLVRK